MHDGFITVFSKIGMFRNEGSFEGWMRRIFVNTALGYLRRSNILGNTEQVENIRIFDEKEGRAVEQMEAQEIVHYIAMLPEGYRFVLNMYAIEGYSHKEIADMLGISEGTSRSQYARAKSYLHKLLKEAEII